MKAKFSLHRYTIIQTQHDTVIPRLIYPAPLEPGSQAAVGLTSTAMGDLAGISGAVSSCFPFFMSGCSYLCAPLVKAFFYVWMQLSMRTPRESISWRRRCIIVR